MIFLSLVVVAITTIIALSALASSSAILPFGSSSSSSLLQLQRRQEDDLSSMLLLAIDNDKIQRQPQPYTYTRHRSLLGVNQFNDPRTQQIKINNNVNTMINNSNNLTLTVYIQDPDNAIFNTDILPRYTSSKFNYNIVHDWPGCDCNNEEPILHATTNDAFCLVVTNYFWKCTLEEIKCKFPQCKVMITNDEFCRAPPIKSTTPTGDVDYHVREYYNSQWSYPKYAFLPLGPRLDSWTSLQKILHEPGIIIKPASQRKYIFNAIFSQSTNSDRNALAAHLMHPEHNTKNYPIYKAISARWNPDADAEGTTQLNTHDTMSIFLDSIFTLSPRGHSPECYRLYEAIETGSIPIVTKRDIFMYKNKLCKDPLKFWHTAPVVVMESWDELYPTVEKLLGDMKRLEEMQLELRQWYDEMMRGVVGKFEEYMVQSWVSRQEGVGGGELIES